MGDREIPQFNRVIFAKWGNRTQELHLQRLRKDIKPVIDTSPPPSFAHLADRRKIKQKWSDEQSRIEYENMLLLNRMRSIMTETQNKQFIDAGQAGSAQGGSQSILLGTGAASQENKGSLNRGERIREMKRILHENEALLARIQNRGPTYNVAEWEAQHIQKEKQLAGMGRFKYVSTTLPPQVMAELARPKVIKRYGTLRFPVPKPGTEAYERHHASSSSIGSFASEPDQVSSPLSPGSGKATTPRRVHHLPPKAATEEKQERAASAKKRAASAGKRKKPAPPRPVEFSLQLEQITGHLTSSDDVPRVFVYLRQESGDYTPHAEVALQPMDLPAGLAWRGVSVVPGLDLAQGEEDRRIRIAIFSPADPVFSSAQDAGVIQTPKDNTYLIGEARFSLSHFAHFQRPFYKLKILRHGLPIAGANFGRNGTAPSDMPEEEVERRRALQEAILVLQHTNKELPTEEDAETPAKALAPEFESGAEKQDQPDEESKDENAGKEKAAAAAKKKKAEAEKAKADKAAAAAAKKEAEDKAKAAAVAAKKEADEKAKADKLAAEKAAAEEKKARADSAAKKKAAAAEKAAAEADPRVAAVRAALSSTAGMAVLPPNTRVTSELAQEFVEADVDAKFLERFLAESQAERATYDSAQALVSAAASSRSTFAAARAKVLALVEQEGLLPKRPSAPEAEQLARDSGVALSARAEACEKNSSALVSALASLGRKGLKFQQLPHLVTAVKKELLGAGGSEQEKEAAAATKIQALQRGRATRAAAKEKDAPPAKSAQQVLDEIQASKAAQEAEVARVMAEQGLKPTQQEEEEDEVSKPYVEDEVHPTSTAQAPAPATAQADKQDDEFPSYEDEIPGAAATAASAGSAAAGPAKTTKSGRPSPTPDQAATKIQALQRGRSVRARKAQILEEKRRAKEEAAARRAAEKKAREQEARDDAAAEQKRAAEAEALKRKQAEEAERERKHKEEEAALLAKAKADEIAAAEKKAAEELARQESAQRDAEAKAAEEARKKAELEQKKKEAEELQAKQEAEAKAKADAEAKKQEEEKAAAKKAAEEVEKEVAKQQSLLQSKTFTLTLTVGCKNIPGLTPTSVPSPMIALYGKDLSTGSFTFISQTERIQGSKSPVFAEALVVTGVTGEVERQLMFSVYNVSNEDSIKEEDVTGTALSDQKDLFKLVARKAAGAPFQSVQLPIAQSGAILPDAFVTITNVSYEETAPVAAAASSAPAAAAEEPVDIPEDSVGIWVSIKNLVLPAGVTEVKSLVALYTKDNLSSNFNYLSQTDVLPGLTPKFLTPLVIAKPAAGHDTDCMLNVYNHLAEDAEVSDASTLGACLFSLNRLLASTKGAVSVALVRGGQVCGQVILRTRADASSTNVSRPGTAPRNNPASARSGSAKPSLDVYDLTISCAKLPKHENQKTCEPMVALYGQDPATEQFQYIGQTEKGSSDNPVFESKIRMDEHSGGGPDGDRALMMMVYNVLDEANIQETDQIGTCALTWKFLKDQQQQSVTLPLLTSTGEQHPEATITIKVQKV